MRWQRCETCLHASRRRRSGFRLGKASPCPRWMSLQSSASLWPASAARVPSPLPPLLAALPAAAVPMAAAARDRRHCRRRPTMRLRASALSRPQRHPLAGPTLLPRQRQRPAQRLRWLGRSASATVRMQRWVAGPTRFATHHRRSAVVALRVMPVRWQEAEARGEAVVGAGGEVAVAVGEAVVAAVVAAAVTVAASLPLPPLEQARQGQVVPMSAVRAVHRSGMTPSAAHPSHPSVI